MKIKICCISSEDEARMAIEAGADMLGLVSEMPSGPGVIGEETITRIVHEVPMHIETFLLTSLQSAKAIIAQHHRCQTTTLQLVDEVSLPDLEAIRRQLPSIGLVQVIHMFSPDPIRQAQRAAPYVDRILLDSGNPGLAIKELGGTGRTHDWQESARLVAAVDKPVLLAGGLHAGNAAEAIATVRPAGLDICSGVRSNGALDEKKLHAFITAARSQASS